MELRQRRPSYDYKSYFWPLAGIMVVILMARAKIYSYNYYRVKL